MKKIAVTAAVTSAAWIALIAYVVSERRANQKARRSGVGV